MHVKLALRNIRRSFKDYGIYFITLVFGVAVFYAFNSVTDQQILFDIEGTANESVFDMTGTFLSIFSILIACVLGFLVVYANRFLIRRRKHEFGIYLTLGMKPGRVSQIVLLETIIVGLASLAVGLMLGVALSQGLSFMTAGMFNITMTQYRFIFSPDAFLLTLACFALIYIIVALFNTVSINRYTLIDLLSARSKNEHFGVRNPWISFGVFVVAIGIIAASYVTLIENGLLELDGKFWLATGLMLVGTLLFFWSLAGFVIAIVQRMHGVYFRGLAMFTLRQISSKVNTAFLSLWLVCVMLFFSITVFSTGMGLVSVFTGDLDEGTIYDATLTAFTDPNDELNASEEDIALRLRAAIPTWDDFVEGAVQVDVYQSGTTTYGEVMEQLGMDTGNETANKNLWNQNIAVIGQTQFNELRAMTGRELVDVGRDGYAVNNAVALTAELSEALVQPGVEIEVAGDTLHSTDILVRQGLWVTSFVGDGAELIVPDEVIETLRVAGEKPVVSYLNLDYRVDRTVGDAMLYDALGVAFPVSDQQDFSGLFVPQPGLVESVSTSDEARMQAVGMRMMITYLALYVGFVFLITTAAVLAIQQLSEANDSLPRYRLLAQIGCDGRMIFSSLRTQVLIYFLTPLGLAVCHAACATGVLGTFLFDQVGVSVIEPIMMTALLVVVVYGSYLLVTYLASRSIIKGSLGKKLL